MKACAAVLLSVCIFLAGCDEQPPVYSDPYDAFRQKRWVRAMVDELEASLRKVSREGDVAVCINTSGAISGLNLNFFLDHIRAIAAERQRALYLVIGAAEVDWEGRYEGPETLAVGSPAELAIARRSRGETDFRGLLQRGLALDPALTVYWANGFGVLPAKKPPLPVVWVLNQRCWTGPKGENYNPQCHDLEDFGTVISMLDGAP